MSLRNDLSQLFIVKSLPPNTIILLLDRSLPLSAFLRLDRIGWSRTERKSCFPMSLTSSSSSRDRNKYGGIRFILQAKSRTRLNRIAIAERASLEEVDGPFPYLAIFISVTKGRRWRQRYFTLCYLMLALSYSPLLSHGGLWTPVISPVLKDTLVLQDCRFF